MDSLSSGPVADVLANLYIEAERADAPMRESEKSSAAPSGDWTTAFIASEKADLRGTYASLATNFLCVSPKFGRHLYMTARASRARLIVEFGTSMGVSTIYAAAALRDNGSGGARIISTELEPSKAERARKNVAAAGLQDLVEFRVGDARETLAGGVGGGDKIDLVLLDGAWSLYLPVLRLLEPHLRPGAVILADNAADTVGGYIEYVRDPSNGYLSLPLDFGEKQGNEYSVRTK
ncbi:O-methyltransferase, family 3 [Beauveria bassiana ARSEF 2860]|uniref:O-methyltransferase, family 3 n=1 Tax=Beauveria bassiana (strain ARSEF 2860) TaxID=655819 RepID=J5J2Z7_BEAB2|nr:O-methyltransferase, family 3 [Beauveria bassiana ARSEF 2860]EJP61173.1 O-methyltransferase, family 3 [Beauveria bassiana ARSEF 2860]